VPVVTPQVSETTRTTSIPAALAVYWHLLSLDAPTVAGLWCWSFGRAAHIELPSFSPLVLALGTWLVYVADRILDGLDPANRPRLRERHYFYCRHRRAFLVAGVVISPFFAWIVFRWLSQEVRLEDSAVFAVAALYFLLVHAHGRFAERWLPKELAVGLLFAAGTAIPAWARIPGQRLEITPMVGVFAILCWLNCVAIENWESPAADSIHATTAWAGKNLQSLSSAVFVLSLVLAFIHRHDDAQICLFSASAIAALLLFGLASGRRFLTAMQARVAADMAMLTPVLFAAWMR
jgi:hypothetical protein